MAKGGKNKTRFLPAPAALGAPPSTTRSGHSFCAQPAFAPSVLDFPCHAADSNNSIAPTGIDSTSKTLVSAENVGLCIGIVTVIGSLDTAYDGIVATSLDSASLCHSSDALHMLDNMPAPLSKPSLVSSGNTPAVGVAFSINSYVASYALPSLPGSIVQPVLESNVSLAFSSSHETPPAKYGLLPSESVHVTINTLANANKPWSSLFAHKPRSAGEYSPRKFTIDCVDGVIISPPEVIDAGTLFWKDQIVGFFLDKHPSYSVVHDHLKRIRKLKGHILMRYDNTIFYFHFPCPDDRQMVLERGPVIIAA